jgi:hypothetical protein
MQYDKHMCYVKLKYKNVSVKYKCKRWLPFETVVGVWNFSAVLQNKCLLSG